MNVRNFSNNTGAENYAAHMARQMNSEEESTMNANESKQGMLKTISGINPTRLIIGLALGAALLTATALTLGGQANANSLSKTTTIQTTQEYSDDEWRFGPPFIEVNPGASNSQAKVTLDSSLPITADDEFVFGAPYVELNPGAASVGDLWITADYEFVFGAPYVELNPGAASVADLRITADDEFVFGSPFVDSNLGTSVTPGV